MKRIIKYLIINSLTIFLCFFIIMSCSKDNKPKSLSVPENINITIEGRIMTVTWDEVSNSQGYEIVLTSEGCGSGNRTINTREMTAIISGSENAASNVQITGKTTVKVTLMAASGDRDRPMAKAVTAKIKAFSSSGSASVNGYTDSAYSQEVRKIIQ